MKSITKKRLEAIFYQGLTGPKRKALKSAWWTDTLMKVFMKHTKLNDAEIKRYVIYILRACDIEKGTDKQIDDRIRQRKQQYQGVIDKNNHEGKDT